MKCKYCNSIIDENTNYCPYCGKEQLEIYKCSVCRKTFQVHKKMAFCPNCGNKIEEDDENSDHEESPEVYNTDNTNNTSNPLEEHVRDFLNWRCDKDTLDIVCFTAFIFQIVYLIYYGDFLGFKGFFYDLSYNLTNILPEWLLPLILNLSYLYIASCVIDTCNARNIYSWVNYCLPIAWGILILLYVIANFTFIRNEDLKLLLQFAIVIDVMQIYLASLINKSDLGWLAKVIIATSVCSILQILIPCSIILFTIDVIVRLYYIHTVRQLCYNY